MFLVLCYVLGTQRKIGQLMNLSYDGGPADLIITGKFKFTLNQVPGRHRQTLALYQSETSE